MTNAEELERAWTTAPDSAWAAEWARVALEHGRIELGYQVSKIAVQAHRYEQTPKPIVPPPPIVPGAEAAPVFDGLREHLNAAQANDYLTVARTNLLRGQHVTEAADDLAAVAGDVNDTATTLIATQTVIPNGRCAYAPPGALECHRVVYYDPDAARWTHMDPDVDALHAPVPPIVLPAANNGAAAQ